MNGTGNKIVLMAIAVVAIGIFALPGTISVFGGLHTWYELGGARGGEYMPCIKCHADVYEEYVMMARHAPHRTLERFDPNTACYACHRVNPDIRYAAGSGFGAIPGKQAHAASTVACVECHEFKSNEVHKKHSAYVQAAKKYGLMKSSNEACIACHTDIAMDINWTNSG